MNFNYKLNNALYHLLTALDLDPNNRRLDIGIDILIEYMQESGLNRDVDNIVQAVIKERESNEWEWIKVGVLPSLLRFL